jgi:hypothetical protein
MRVYNLKTAVCLFCACAAMPCLAATEAYTPPPFGHYQPILDRMPFGALPANFGQTPVDPALQQSAAQIQAEQQKLAKQVNMSAVNITPEGQTAIGFTDLEAKPPVNYFLLVGTSANGWTVVSADYDEETATLLKDNVTITLKLGKGLVEPSAPSAKAAVAPLEPSPARRDSMPAYGKASALLRGASANPVGAALPSPVPAGQVPAVRPVGMAAAERSYKERLLERKTQQSAAQQALAQMQQEQLEQLARAAALKEITRREEEAAQAAAEQPVAETSTPAAEVPEPAQEEPAAAPQPAEGNVQ